MSTVMPLVTMNLEPDSPIRALVVQPEMASAQALAGLLDEYGGLDVLEPCDGIASAAAAIRSSNPEIIIADGFMAAEIQDTLESAAFEPAPLVLFTGPASGSDLPSVALTMLTRGVCLELELLRAKVEVQQRRLRLLARLRRSQAGADSPAPMRRFAIRIDNRIVFVRPEEIDWIQAAGNYVRLHVGDVSYPVRMTMSRMEQSLPLDGFMRVHRNAIVNLDHVREFQIPPTGNMFAVLRNGKQLPLSRGYRGDLRAYLCRSLGVSCPGSGITEARRETGVPLPASAYEGSLRHNVVLH